MLQVFRCAGWQLIRKIVQHSPLSTPAKRSIASLDAGILYTSSGLQGAAVAASAASAALEGHAESGTPPEPPASALLALTDCITRACMPALHGPGVSCALTLWCHKMIRDITIGFWSTSIQRRPHIAPGASLQTLDAVTRPGW